MSICSSTIPRSCGSGRSCPCVRPGQVGLLATWQPKDVEIATSDIAAVQQPRSLLRRLDDTPKSELCSVADYRQIPSYQGSLLGGVRDHERHQISWSVQFVRSCVGERWGGYPDTLHSTHLYRCSRDNTMPLTTEEVIIFRLANVHATVPIHERIIFSFVLLSQNLHPNAPFFSSHALDVLSGIELKAYFAAKSRPPNTYHGSLQTDSRWCSRFITGQHFSRTHFR